MYIKNFCIFVLLILVLFNPTNYVFSGVFDGNIYKSITNIEERRKYIRLNTNKLKYPIIVYSNNNLARINDISRGGISLQHNNNLNVGDILSLVIKYKDINIQTQGKVVFSNIDSAGVEFTNPDKNISNKILYLSILLEADNNLLITRLKEEV